MAAEAGRPGTGSVLDVAKIADYLEGRADSLQLALGLPDRTQPSTGLASPASWDRRPDPSASDRIGFGTDRRYC